MKVLLLFLFVLYSMGLFSQNAIRGISFDEKGDSIHGNKHESALSAHRNKMIIDKIISLQCNADMLPPAKLNILNLKKDETTSVEPDLLVKEFVLGSTRNYTRISALLRMEGSFSSLFDNYIAEFNGELLEFGNVYKSCVKPAYFGIGLKLYF